MATSAIGTTRSALKTLIVAQLSGVNVYSFFPGAKALEGVAAYEFVTLGDVDNGSQEHLAFGGSREELFTITGFVWVAKPGTGETQSAAAENRALVLLAGVETAVRTDDTPGSAFHAEMVGYRIINTADDNGAVCQIEFDIEVEAHL